MLHHLSTGAYLDWLVALDRPDMVQPYERPAPCPPVSCRPLSASATKIDLWMKDPYAIYLYYILKIKPLRPLQMENDAALRGTILHAILEDFNKTYPNDLPENAYDALIEIGHDRIKDVTQSQEMLHYWWPRFVRIAQHYICLLYTSPSPRD